LTRKSVTDKSSISAPESFAAGLGRHSTLHVRYLSEQASCKEAEGQQEGQIIEIDRFT